MDEWSYQYAMNRGRAMIREGFMIASVCLWISMIFGFLAASGFGGSDASQIGWLGFAIFVGFGLLYGGQAFSFKYRLNKALRNG